MPKSVSLSHSWSILSAIRNDKPTEAPPAKGSMKFCICSDLQFSYTSPANLDFPPGYRNKETFVLKVQGLHTRESSDIKGVSRNNL